MSDHGHHDPGGHELEAINTTMLFRLFFVLIVITLGASYAVVQWFYFQRAELEDRYAVEGSFQLKNYEAAMGEQLEGLDGVAKRVGGDAKLLAAPAPPAGWIHPDDLVGAGAAAPAAAPAAADDHADHDHADHAEPAEGAPAEGEPTEGAPTEGAPTEGAPTEGAPTEGAPAGDAAAKPEGEPADKAPEGEAKPNEAKPADNAANGE